MSVYFRIPKKPTLKERWHYQHGIGSYLFDHYKLQFDRCLTCANANKCNSFKEVVEKNGRTYYYIKKHCRDKYRYEKKDDSIDLDDEYDMTK